ncbi:NADH-quinone oxidoreductase subunit NuoN [Peribacillus simplex]|uniref:NADH-quinone oxidoreductase subunit N n=1 Tax=Peribacillus simplex TaxID=1478 RepID=A0AAN2PDH6_9BACI|nr:MULTISPECIES: NADH-quinone oxidoreductase subunit NuoN [Peribacillus]MCP1092790.1 NADH-quinone oxidoreductase subunit NuoN [Bacillaceae bacterium OS4b]MBD8587100.1 NADH-quinone oxidoreductase subunit NuoN [Peribacillus simplex]MCP1155751.1 NADH-quinone oxidoreductase subunit NuoN [Peribacillus frigoritolerans]MCT1387717.1 NADH-quinone oxidoreductase subunit NuoN [Peribacillus frigoritolerans]MEA3574689.1 NADH-quinone oxidoreductase subunit NuoN [Peribacillus frigoritolerans]
MDWNTMLSYDWGAMMPEFIILGTTMILSILDLFWPKHFNRRKLAWLALTGIILACLSLISLLSFETVSILSDTFRLDSFAKAFKLLLLFGAALIILLAEGYEPKEGLREHRGEFYYLFLTALLGAMVMSSSGDLITLFVGLELLSLSSYILVGMRKHDRKSNEASMKYVINGGISTAITLFGMSYLYGVTGSVNLGEMSRTMAAMTDGQLQYIMGLAFFMVFVGVSFKIAAAPFHMWAPDVYEGAPTPVAAFLSVISKMAGFVIILRLFLSLFLTASGDTFGALDFLDKNNIYIASLAGLTIIIGNVVALRQQNLKRMFAYSSIAHAGYLLVAVATLGGGYFLLDTVWFYLMAYVLMNIGVFAVIQLLSSQSGSEDISILAGLGRKSPYLAMAFTVFILSLAGIPGTTGFIGKLNIFLGTFITEPGHFVLAGIMIAGTIVSYVYYFGLLVQVFFRPIHSEKVIKIRPGLYAVLIICVIGTILFGVAPNIAFDFIHDQFGDFTDFISSK